MNNPRFQDLSKFTMPKKFRGKSRWIVQIWWIIEGLFFRLSPQFMYGFRNWLLRAFGAQIGKDVKIRPTVKITYPWNLIIGDNCWVGDDSNLYNLGKITLGNNVALAHKVYLCTGMHDYLALDFGIYAKEIVIQDEVWLANDVFIGPGVTIFEGAVVGARSTVLNDLPGGKICYGYPAKPVKDRIIKS